MPTPGTLDATEKVMHSPGGINTALQQMDYAVRGSLVIRAEQLAREIKQHPDRHSFSKITYCNIGNPQSVSQPPVTYLRQVIAALACPSLIDGNEIMPDAADRARSILSECSGVGAYSESRGIEGVRERVAGAIERRDGVSSRAQAIFLTNGASEAVKTLLALLIRRKTDGVMVPIPQYPLYSATMTALGGSRVDYFLDEENGWGLHVDQLERSLKDAREEGIDVRAIVVINPGNPTGQVLSRENIEAVVRFCERERLVILADEVYQKNVYVKNKPFVSFKKVVCEMGSEVELASFHSVSKGVLGECGLRGGYVEVHNMLPEVEALIYKVLSVSLCSNIIGQAAIDMMMNPPKPGDASYETYTKETETIYNGLKRKALLLSDALNSFEGVSCNESEGAMYLFPRVSMPEPAIKESERRGYKCVDVMYCMELLEETGVCVVPGSGFGQREGTFHFRTTFLPAEQDIERVIESMRKFHVGFMARYS